MRSASYRAGTLSRMQPSRMRSGGQPVLRMFICPLPLRMFVCPLQTCPSRLLTRSRASAGTIPAHAAAARSSRSAAWAESLAGRRSRACSKERARQTGATRSSSDPFSLATLTVELLATCAAAEPAIALGGALGSLRDGFRSAFQAPHLRPPLCEKRPYTRPSPPPLEAVARALTEPRNPARIGAHAKLWSV